MNVFNKKKQQRTDRNLLDKLNSRLKSSSKLYIIFILNLNKILGMKPWCRMSNIIIM